MLAKWTRIYKGTVRILIREVITISEVKIYKDNLIIASWKILSSLSVNPYEKHYKNKQS